MKLEVGRLNVPTVADSSYALRILRWLGIFTTKHDSEIVRASTTALIKETGKQIWRHGYSKSPPTKLMVSPKRVALKTKDNKLWIVTKFRILGSTMMMSAV